MKPRLVCRAMRRRRATRRASGVWAGVIPAVALAATLWGAGSAHAQAATESELRDPAVLEALDGRRLQTEIDVQSGDAPLDLEAPSERRSRAEPTIDRDVSVWIVRALLVAILVVAVILALRNASGGLAVFARRPEDARINDPAAAAPQDAPLPEHALALDALRRMADREEAFRLLVLGALQRAATQNHMRLGRAQTLRDVIRSLPSGWPHLQALRGLARVAERVHFGGEALGEDTFERCLELARPIYRAGGA